MVLNVCTIKGRHFILGPSDELTKLPSEVLYFSMRSEKRDKKKKLNQHIRWNLILNVKSRWIFNTAHALEVSYFCLSITYIHLKFIHKFKIKHSSLTPKYEAQKSRYIFSITLNFKHSNSDAKIKGTKFRLTHGSPEEQVILD